MSLLIGLIDQAINTSDKVSWGDSKIGGQPIWMSNSTSSAVRKCHGCTKDMTLVVQLYCPLSNSAYHRCLYIFVCASSGCTQHNSWKVFRSMQYDQSYAPTKSQEESSSNLFDNDMWTDGQDDWGDDDDDDDDWGNTATSGDNWGLSEFDNSTSKGAVGGSTFHPNSNSAITPCSTSTSYFKKPTVLSSDEKVQNGNIHDKGNNFQTCVPESTKGMLDDLSPHSATDQDLSACFSTMDVEDNIDKAGAGGDALMEDLNIPDTSRLDQLASVLNTKYKDSPATAQASEQRPLQLRSYYLSVVEGNSQESRHAADDSHIASLIREYEEVEGKQIKEIISQRAQVKGKGGSEVYEKSSVKHGDKVFHKFWKEIRKFPEQCIRYDRSGQPLLVQSLSPVQVVIPPCPKCEGPRVFELQLVPALIPWLCSQEGKPSDIEFGAILVFTCDKSCPPSSGNDHDLLEEHVIVQHDPDHHLYR